MNIYLLTRADEINEYSYNYYTGAVVIAKSAPEVRITNLSENWGEWCKPKDVIVELIGKAKKGKKPGIILSQWIAE
jgi:hypothetical protein